MIESIRLNVVLDPRMVEKLVDSGPLTRMLCKASLKEIDNQLVTGLYLRVIGLITDDGIIDTLLRWSLALVEERRLT